MGIGRDPSDDLADAVNAGVDVEAFKKGVQRTHNALQRYMFRQVFRPGIVALAGVSQTDARNEGTVATCREICDEMGWDY